MKNCLGIVIGLTAVSWLISPSARACTPAEPGISSRAVWPDGTQSIPTNSRLVIAYGAVNGGTAIPAFGPDVLLLDASGSSVSFTMEVTGNLVVVRPDGGLLPNHGYQLADQRTIPCMAIASGCALTAAPAVFASFTTGPGTDDVAPLFAGVTGASVGSHLTCGGSACCGPYDLYLVDVSWASASDDVAGGDLRYNVYRRDGSSLTPVAPLAQGTSLSGERVCSGDGAPGLESGDYVVRAVDWAGNEDTNLAARHLGDPCSPAAAGCSVAASRSSSDGLPWSTLVAMAIVGVGIGRSARRARRPQPSHTPAPR